MLKILMVLLSLFAAPALAQNWPGALAIPVHGNWCGPGQSGNGGAWNAPPTDALDAACLRHDICTTRAGYGTCGCDIALMTELRATPWPNPGLQSKARAVYDAIAVSPCRRPDGQMTKMRMAYDDWQRDVASGRAAPMDFLRRWGLLGLDGIDGRLRRGY